MIIANTILSTLPPPQATSKDAPRLAAQRSQPKLSVVGAGPGDPELLTLKAFHAIRSADVVLYDALANTEILTYCKPDARIELVGKRGGKPSVTQEEINERIVQYACSHGHVVRLKGGDPFVFGRGFEEILHARQHGIPTEYIPGISSAISVAGLFDIPLTHRGTSESFWVITGSTAASTYSRDLHAAAQTNATVVVLMGLATLPAIVEVYAQHGKADTPVAVIQNGSLPFATKITSTIAGIVPAVQQADLAPPAVIVIGSVVNLTEAALQLASEAQALC